eukprot:Gb_03889 [translate_table: standard]
MQEELLVVVKRLQDKRKATRTPTDFKMKAEGTMKKNTIVLVEETLVGSVAQGSKPPKLKGHIARDFLPTDDGNDSCELSVAKLATLYWTGNNLFWLKWWPSRMLSRRPWMIGKLHRLLKRGADKILQVECETAGLKMGIFIALHVLKICKVVWGPKLLIMLIVSRCVMNTLKETAKGEALLMSSPLSSVNFFLAERGVGLHDLQVLWASLDVFGFSGHDHSLNQDCSSFELELYQLELDHTGSMYTKANLEHTSMWVPKVSSWWASPSGNKALHISGLSHTGRLVADSGFSCHDRIILQDRKTALVCRVSVLFCGFQQAQFPAYSHLWLDGLTSTSGCPYGERCHFLHYVPGGINSLGFAPLAMLPSPVMARAGRKQIVAGSDPSLTVNGYKTRLCSRYKTLEGCRFGEKCHFAHGESDFRPANNFCSNGRTMIKDPATQSTTEPAMQTTFGMPAVQSAPVMFDTGPVTYDYETSATFVNSTPFVTATTFADSTPFE